MAKVAPLLKKGCKDISVTNRPLIITLVVGELLDGILRDIICFCRKERQGPIRDNRHRFVRRKSYPTNVIELFEEATKRIDEGRIENAVYVNFSKALNKVLPGG